jgi:uncharacterized phiE125 gp8 family phage protein
VNLRWVNLERTSEPAAEPVPTAELKAFCRVTHSDDDTKIAALGTAAREIIEDWTRRSLITQTWKITLNNDLVTGEIYRLPRPKIISVTSVDYVDIDGNLQTGYATSNYHTVIGEDGGIWFEDIPDTDSVPEPIRITYTAGYGASADDVPSVIQTAIKLLVSEWYSKRTAEGSVPEWVTSIVKTKQIPLA